MLGEMHNHKTMREALARDYVTFIKDIPMLNEKFANNSGETKPLESFYGEMVAQLLMRDLPGYKDYCMKTRYRLIPSIW